MRKNPIILFAKWQVKKGHLDSVLNLLTEVSQKSENEAGNLFYDLYQSHNNPDMLIFCEGYADDASLASHQKSEHFQRIVIDEIAPMLEEVEVILTAPVQLDI
ncbi:putative quinol monooxygenase [Dyadobacter fanqingshengii]|uniref:Antibiotic biosynthesis monooxygenase n=1 Tax=Dyadobacter fanqingshengii TaxID=2906443 RepID=A0A9X1PAC4_9BACT|nr:putative quinol monooxygenase [Dyadobacter fanqingshengii]MCF0039720.1 antibiotic biosynthesis monooxygenase [Dyadobacter fanqingshengii]USJ38517.1 antibiotic biosynthesis monooxygenase [Dyadobacter fanqingshengii]